jgi:hypothetical protein
MMAGLRLKDLKDFMWDDDWCGGKELYLEPGWQNSGKSDLIKNVLTAHGIKLLRSWVKKHWAFVTNEALLEKKTFQILIDQVNDRSGLKKSGLKDPEDLLSRTKFFPMNSGGNEPEGKSWPSIQPEFTDSGYPNPLYCKDYLYEKGRNIMMAKNHDYRGGSGDPYANFRGSVNLGINPIVGILLRVEDKIQRIRTFASKGKLMVENEGVEDALVDVQNYMDLIYGLIKEARNENSE